MNLEMKSIKHSQWASQETHCYTANVYLDGKPFAVVSNDGHGGCDYDYAHPKFKGDYRVTMKRVDDYFASLPMQDVGKYDWSPEGFAQKFEYWCSDQVNDFLFRKEMRKVMKKNHLFKTSEGLFEMSHKACSQIIHRDYPDAVILNEIPEAEALEIYKESVQ